MGPVPIMLWSREKRQQACVLEKPGSEATCTCVYLLLPRQLIEMLLVSKVNILVYIMDMFTSVC